MSGRCILCGSETRPLTKVAIPANETGTRIVLVCADAEACVRDAKAEHYRTIIDRAFQRSLHLRATRHERLS